jgi:hypothetical protein
MEVPQFHDVCRGFIRVVEAVVDFGQSLLPVEHQLAAVFVVGFADGLGFWDRGFGIRIREGEGTKHNSSWVKM